MKHSNCFVNIRQKNKQINHLRINQVQALFFIFIFLQQCICVAWQPGEVWKNTQPKPTNCQTNNLAAVLWRNQTLQKPRDPVLISRDVVVVIVVVVEWLGNIIFYYLFVLVVLFQKPFRHHRCYSREALNNHVTSPLWPLAALRVAARTPSHFNGILPNQRRLLKDVWILHTDYPEQGALVTNRKWFE